MDSNGQAVWSLCQHALLSNDLNLVKEKFNSLLKGIKWIDNARLKSDEYKNEVYYGLLPEGMSAEHLGLSDYYYWDNFWAIAAIEIFIEFCEMLDKEKELAYSQSLLIDYKSDLENSIKNVQQNSSTKCIPASPTRDLDYGMIGSVCGTYPLQIFGANDSSILNSLDYIYNNFTIENLFYQNFIHSGLNIYLSLQIAHSFLLSGEREKFWSILQSVNHHASPTYNFPEAIHTQTNGGVMGDGHHGWAAAEILLAYRDAFVFEENIYSKNNSKIILLQGVPKNWFKENNHFYIRNTNLICGKMSLEIKVQNSEIFLRIDFESNNLINLGKMILSLPFNLGEFEHEGERYSPVEVNDEKISYELPLTSMELKIKMKHKNISV